MTRNYKLQFLNLLEYRQIFEIYHRNKAQALLSAEPLPILPTCQLCDLVPEDLAEHVIMQVSDLKKLRERVA